MYLRGGGTIKHNHQERRDHQTGSSSVMSQTSQGSELMMTTTHLCLHSLTLSTIVRTFANSA